jgi:predicted PhzF superfamily epimerase YddE/YHI9
MAAEMASAVLHLLAAFTTTPGGGNPAGVWIGDALPDPARGRAMERPSLIVVEVPAEGGIVVSGETVGLADHNGTNRA